MTPIAIPRLAALAALLVAGMFAPTAFAQEGACQIARAELAAHDRGGGGGSHLQRRASLDSLIAYYHSAGCGGASLPLFGQRPPQCRQIEARIGQLQMEASGRGGGDSSRRAQLVAAVGRACNPAPVAPSSALSASSRVYDLRDEARSGVVIDGEEQPSDAPRITPLGRAMCVRACDGFYFPLSNAPGGRDGADAMCQALCPAAETRAFFLDKGGVDSATDSQGARYASLRNAYKFRREVSSTCTCRKPGQSWSSALRDAEGMISPQPGDVTVTEQNRDPAAGMTLRPSTRPDARTAARPMREQPIDPEPLDLEPEPLSPEPSGIAEMTPRIAPSPEPQINAPAPADGPRKPARVVGPGMNTDVGRPMPIPPRASANSP